MHPNRVWCAAWRVGPCALSEPVLGRRSIFGARADCDATRSALATPRLGGVEDMEEWCGKPPQGDKHERTRATIVFVTGEDRREDMVQCHDTVSTRAWPLCGECAEQCMSAAMAPRPVSKHSYRELVQ